MASQPRSGAFALLSFATANMTGCDGSSTWLCNRQNKQKVNCEALCRKHQFLHSTTINSAVSRCRSYWLISIDYRCADGRFLMSPRGMAVSNTKYFSSSETRVNAGIKGWKWHLSESTWCQESVGASLGLTVHFLGVNIAVFWKRESRPIEWRQCRSQLLPTYFVCTSILINISILINRLIIIVSSRLGEQGVKTSMLELLRFANFCVSALKWLNLSFFKRNKSKEASNDS